MVKACAGNFTIFPLYLGWLAPTHSCLSLLPHAQAMVKACAGNFTIFPLYLGSFFLYMGLLEGLPPPEAVQKLRQAFVPT